MIDSYQALTGENYDATKAFLAHAVNSQGFSIA